MKRALITGITGQDGAYLAELLLEKGYEVHGMKRRSSLPNTGRLKGLIEKIHIHEGDLTDTGGLFSLIKTIEPDEIYNLAAQSDVAVSFHTPEFTANVNALGVLRLLEAIRILGLKEKCRFYQASTSELFGSTPPPQSEKSPFYPRSPYAVAKLYAYWITINYREAYGLFAANGILFNHESPLRGEQFVTRKITRTLARVVLGLEEKLSLGNLNALRDWGHAKEAVEMQWRILQQKEPGDYVIASGEANRVRDFVNEAAGALGFTLAWEGEGVHEKGRVASVEKQAFRDALPIGKVVVDVDEKFFRPSETDSLLGDAKRAQEKLGFEPKITFKKLVSEMAEADLKRAEEELWRKSLSTVG